MKEANPLTELNEKLQKQENRISERLQKSRKHHEQKLVQAGKTVAKHQANGNPVSIHSQYFGNVRVSMMDSKSAQAGRKNEENVEKSGGYYEVDDEHDSENCLDSHMTHHNLQQESLEEYL